MSYEQLNGYIDLAKLLSKTDKKNCTIKIHTAAQPAFDFFHNQAHLFDKTLFNKATLDELNKDSTLHAIRIDNNEIALFSGFEYISFNLTSLDLKQHTIIVFSNLGDEEISQQAWRSVLRTIISSVSSQSIEELRRNLNDTVPSYYIKSIFNKNILSQKKLALLTSSSRDTLAKQYQREKRSHKKSSSIFQQLIQEDGSE